jgi:winged helix-turn helix protein
MARRTLTLTEEQRHQLLELRDHDARPYVRERGAALLKIAEGDTPHRVAKIGLLKPRDPDTVYSWLDRYQASGVQGLITHPQGGSRGRHL